MTPCRQVPGTFRILVRLCPAEFRRFCADEMLDTLASRLSPAHSQSKRRRLALLTAEWLDLLRTLLHEWRISLSRRPSHLSRHRWLPEAEIMKNLVSDLRFAARVLAKSPLWTLLAILTLGLGIGANAALFSVVDGVLLRPLPYKDPHRLAMIWSQWKDFDKTWVSEPEYQYYLQESNSFEDISLFARFTATLTGEEGPERAAAAVITPNTLQVLGVEPSIGRAFSQMEAELDAPLLMLSYELWQRRYGGRQEVVGSSVQLNGSPRVVVGVMPAGFRLPTDFDTESPALVFAPYNVQRESVVNMPRNGGDHGSYAIARLREGVAHQQADAELRGLSQRLTREGIYSQEWDFRPLVIPIEEEILGTVRPALLVLLGAVALVLLIACANVANLLLARGRMRTREIALRSALGAGRGRLVRQMLTESFLLAFAGGVLGLLLAWLGVRWLPELAPANLPRLSGIGIDSTVLAFACLVSLATALAFGIAPAFQALGINLQDALKQGARGAGGGSGQRRFQMWLVAAQAALAVVLLLGTGLMVRTFQNLTRIDPGFRTENILTLRLSTPEGSYPDGPSVTAFYQGLLQRIRPMPGVRSAGAARVLPLASQIGDSGVRIEGYQPPDGASNPKGDWQVITPGYLETLGIPLIRGRLISESDDLQASPVILINQTMARTYWPDSDPIGKRVMAFGGPWQTIVGIVGDVRHNGIRASIKEKWYRPQAQFTVTDAVRGMTVVIASEGDPMQLAAALRQAVREMDPAMPVAQLRTMEDVLSTAVAQPRFTMLLLSLFSGLALLLSLVGIYGVLSFAVNCRTQEIGVRMTLGARTSSVLGLIVREGMKATAAGILVGLLAALGLTRLLASQLHGVSAQDPMTFLSAPLIFALVALAACCLPARRASRLDPNAALRQE